MRLLATYSLAVSEAAGLCLHKTQMEMNCSLPVLMATLSLRGDFPSPSRVPGEIRRTKQLVLPLQRMKKHRTVPRAQACDAGKSIFCLHPVGEFASKLKAKEPVPEQSRWQEPKINR